MENYSGRGREDALPSSEEGQAESRNTFDGADNSIDDVSKKKATDSMDDECANACVNAALLSR